MSLTNMRRVWTLVFLGVFTLGAIVMEIAAGIFHPAGTIPWTEYIARYVPWPIQLAAYVALAVWLPFHFWRHDHMRKIAYKNGRADAIVDLASANALHGRDSAEAAAERALWTRDIAKILRNQTAAPAEMRPGLLYAADFLDPPAALADHTPKAPDDPNRGDVHY